MGEYCQSKERDVYARAASQLVMDAPAWKKLNPPEELRRVFEASPGVRVANGIDELIDIACGGPGSRMMKV